MALVLYFVLTALSVASSRGDGYTHKKYGCLLAPGICTPPEDCSDDGLVGNCQVPYVRSNWTPEKDQMYLLKILRDLESRGYDYSAVKNALGNHDSDWSFQQDDSTLGLEKYLSALEGINKDGTKLSRLEQASSEREYNIVDASKEDDYRQEYRRSPTRTVMDSRSERMRYLVEKERMVLADKGMKFSDLTDEEVENLAKILAEQLIKHPDASIDIGLGNNKEVKNSLEKENVKQPIQKEDIVRAKKVVPIQEIPAESPAERDADSVVSSSIEDEKLISDSAGPQPQLQLHEPPPDHKVQNRNKTLYVVIIVVGATVLLIIIVTILSCAIHAYRSNNKGHKFIGTVAGDEIPPFGQDYQELCRQHYATKNSEHTENPKDMVSDSAMVQEPLITRTYPVTRPNEGETKHNTPGHALSYGNATRNSSVSSTSWSEEPVTASLDITTGHAVLSYMEDHLKNKDRLDKEWEEICGYEADSITTAAAITPQNSRKNRSLIALPYDHNRVKLNPENNHLQSDYINASAIIDNEPKRPLYIAAQGPLASTIPDFWQMMWEQGCVAIVMLTPLVEEGVNQCARYWPDEGSCTYHNFEIHLVSEHIWCEDYLVRSLYLKHLETGETRTVTQFHFLSWPNDRVPSTPKPLLELRRKVTKCYKGHNSPVLVHCSDGVGRTGTYILLDLAIDRMLKGAKEIDIAATLEHIRDQRVGMVGTKEQFEFALTAVAEEVNAILKSLLH